MFDGAAAHDPSAAHRICSFQSIVVRAIGLWARVYASRQDWPWLPPSRREIEELIYDIDRFESQTPPLGAGRTMPLV